MKKLINKLREKPKLYKCLKILGVVGICLSLIFNAIIIGSVIAYNSKGSDNQKVVRNVATTPVKGVLDYNDMVFFEGSMTLSSQLDFWRSYAGKLLGQENLFATGLGSDASQGVNNTSTYNVPSNADIGYITDMTSIFNNGWQGWSSSGVVKISFIQFYVIRQANYDYYEVNIKLDRPDVGSAYNYRRWAMRLYNSGKLDGGTFISGLSSTPYNNNNVDLWLEAIVYGKYSSFYEAYGAGDKDYWQGYSTGYNTGFTAGKREGDTEGYNRGIANAPSNVFDYLARGFNSVASILNIQVLPNLTLGVLLFAPIIVSVIIVVVKMIKG